MLNILSHKFITYGFFLSRDSLRKEIKITQNNKLNRNGVSAVKLHVDHLVFTFYIEMAAKNIFSLPTKKKKPANHQ